MKYTTREKWRDAGIDMYIERFISRNGEKTVCLVWANLELVFI